MVKLNYHDKSKVDLRISNIFAHKTSFILINVIYQEIIHFLCSYLTEGKRGDTLR